MKRKSEIPIKSQRKILLNECQVKLAPYGVKFKHAVITNKERDTGYVFVRALIAFVLKRQGYNLSHIARLFEIKSHASIINLLKFGTKEQGGRRREYEIITKSIVENSKRDEQNKQKSSASGEADKEGQQGAEKNKEEVQTQTDKNAEN